MSKIGQKTIEIPAGVTVTVSGKTVTVVGPAGQMVINAPLSIDIIKTEKTLEIKRLSEDKKTKSLHGLYRQLISNAVSGVLKPWEKGLEVVGTGFNVKLAGEDLNFKVGYSHPVIFKKQPTLKYRVEGANKLFVSGVDKQLVGQVAYQIKLVRKPDVYKGKGIKYIGEKLRIKPGKKAKAAGAAA